MIGVVANERRLKIAEEFFQLFKTPWEQFVAGHDYDVILSTGPVPASCEGDVILCFASEPVEADARSGFPPRGRSKNRIVRLKGKEFPVYGEVAIWTPASGTSGEICDEQAAVGWERSLDGLKHARFGYDLFDEIEFLLTKGQPPQYAGYATLDLHIEVLRTLILEAGVPVLEIPPVPAGCEFISCLTHDIDFVSLRHHRFDRAMCGFFYRATLGTLLDVLQGRCSAGKLAKNVAAVLKWPLVQLGLCEDFWLPFVNYLAVEQGRPSTFFIIPFKNRPGKPAPGRSVKGRGVRYDVGDVEVWLTLVREKGCEVAVHGIDSWESAASGKEELQRISKHAASTSPGLRMHWLFFADQSPVEIEAAGFDYDSTWGYNEAVGYRGGTNQVFRIPGTSRLLELPMHIQDTAMFYPGRMHLTEAQAWPRVNAVIDHARHTGGVVTVLWHDRSLAPERLWGEFYAEVIKKLSAHPTWFATARDVVAWFKKRREIRFTAVSRSETGVEAQISRPASNSGPELVVRLTVPGERPGQVQRLEQRATEQARFDLKSPQAATAQLATAV